MRVIFRLQRFLPHALRQKLQRAFWTRFWEAERRHDEKRVRQPVPTLFGSERAVLIEAIGDQYPFSSLLEVGCAFGQNFHILTKLFPEVSLVGVDPNPRCVDGGNTYFFERGITSAEILPGDARDLSQFADKSFDIVYSSALFLFLPAADAEKAVREMARVSSKRLFFLEQHREGDESLEPRGDGGYWIRDYRRLIDKTLGKHEMDFVKIPNPLWNQERWQELGYLISVKL